MPQAVDHHPGMNQISSLEKAHNPGGGEGTKMQDMIINFDRNMEFRSKLLRGCQQNLLPSEAGEQEGRRLFDFLSRIAYLLKKAVLESKSINTNSSQSGQRILSKIKHISLRKTFCLYIFWWKQFDFSF